ncbi:MAG: SMP-30/gluconolactonase/LRE family protein, partial [Phocaeicola sp.]|nr:SMP-30/gluconolactonase/LRE family protein [Phocaeicola sp.]
MTNAKLLYHCDDRTGEAATWLPSLNCLLWVDIDNGILHQYDASRRTVKNHTFPEMITSIIPWKGHDEEIILAMKNRFIVYHLEKRTYRTLVELTTLHPLWRTNDCKASPAGRIWCGVMHMTEHNGIAVFFVWAMFFVLEPYFKNKAIQ